MLLYFQHLFLISVICSSHFHCSVSLSFMLILILYHLSIHLFSSWKRSGLTEMSKMDQIHFFFLFSAYWSIFFLLVISCSTNSLILSITNCMHYFNGWEVEGSVQWLFSHRLWTCDERSQWAFAKCVFVCWIQSAWSWSNVLPNHWHAIKLRLYHSWLIWKFSVDLSWKRVMTVKSW